MTVAFRLALLSISKVCSKACWVNAICRKGPRVVESAPHPVAGGQVRLRALDGLRLIAALGVLAYHFTARANTAWGGPVTSEWPELGRVAVYGAMGVPLFFMISGFVVLLSAWGRTVGQFAASRVSRLYPAYWLVVVSVLALDAFLPQLAHPGHMSWLDRVANLTMFQSAFGVANVVGPSWTLFNEALFYLLLAGLCVVGVSRNRVLALASLWPLTGALAQQTGSTFAETVLQPDYAPFFCIGMLLFLVYKEGRWTLAPTVLLALNYLYTVHLAVSWAPGWYRAGTSIRVSPVVIALLFLAMILVIVALTMTPAARLDWGWLTVAGAMTYPLYLIHEEWGWALIRLVVPWMPHWLAFVAVVLVLLAVSYGIHRWVERPVQARMRRALTGVRVGT